MSYFPTSIPKFSAPRVGFTITNFVYKPEGSIQRKTLKSFLSYGGFLCLSGNVFLKYPTIAVRSDTACPRWEADLNQAYFASPFSPLF